MLPSLLMVRHCPRAVYSLSMHHWSDWNMRRAHSLSTTEIGLDASHHTHLPSEGKGEDFFFTSALIGTSYLPSSKRYPMRCQTRDDPNVWIYGPSALTDVYGGPCFRGPLDECRFPLIRRMPALIRKEIPFPSTPSISGPTPWCRPGSNR
jgi:hypothetical protein